MRLAGGAASAGVFQGAAHFEVSQHAALHVQEDFVQIDTTGIGGTRHS